VESVQSSATWVLSNHDVVRHPTRYGGGTTGLNRALAATLTMLALPGSAYLYQGEELGLEQVDVPPDQRQDPEFRNGRGAGRDGCRVPLPWSGDEPPFGNGTAAPWLPQPLEWAKLTVEAQRDDPGSTWSFYRDALAARRELVRAGESRIELLDRGQDVVSFRRGDIVVVLNCGTEAIEMPPGEVIIGSRPVDGRLPADTAVWLHSA
jgi:alpha-glucosidase